MISEIPGSLGETALVRSSRHPKIPIQHQACPNITEKALLTRTPLEVMLSSSLNGIPAERSPLLDRVETKNSIGTYIHRRDARR